MDQRETKGLGDEQRFWLDHLQRCETFSGTIEDYVSSHGLVLSAFYSWKKKLTEDRLFSSKRQPYNRFRRVVVAPQAVTSVTCRIGLPNGTTVEWPCYGERDLEVVLRVASTLP
ncbi:MAG: hypothetical protein HQL58_04085 [Magnetococcales bacterium]|nr:hypothetical protein [Magnetococcales bacterium]